jgi:hypothetical protein
VRKKNFSEQEGDEHGIAAAPISTFARIKQRQIRRFNPVDNHG